MEQFKEILDKLQKIEIQNAVTHERLKDVRTEVKEQQNEISALTRRVDKHDKIVGAITIFVVILTTVFGLLINSAQILGVRDDRRNSIEHTEKP